MARYIDSVPLLTNAHRVKGYTWVLRGVERDADRRPILPDGATYIGGLPDGGVLVATESPVFPVNPPLSAVPWKIQFHNDAAGTIPFATLSDDGRYTHFESFSLTDLDEDPDAPDTGPHLCTFLCGQTSGTERLCDD